ncbi:MAG: NAD(P)/FAD-dependent oxidoreductase [Alphaproteobacteria bacterium]
MVERAETDTVVIGAGVVGLACARELARRGRDVVILEAESEFGSHTSARNSEVIHAGIYYTPGSLKARLCVEGKSLLYDYCRSRGIAFRNCGKHIVATDPAQIEKLLDLRKTAEANGVDDLIDVEAAGLREREPAVRAVAALYSPSTGIIDSHGLMLSYLGEAEDKGAMLALNCPVVGGDIRKDGILLKTGGEAPMEVLARQVINSAGLTAARVSATMEGLDPATIPTLYLHRGCYFTLSGKSPFNALVYPVPPPGSLGVHVTMDLGGNVRFGPDTEPVDSIDYSVDPGRATMFYDVIRTYWPDLPDGALQPGYAGIRPKVDAVGGAGVDFMIQGPAETGVAGLVCLYGIESPGLTSSLAIARHVASLLEDQALSNS